MISNAKLMQYWQHAIPIPPLPGRKWGEDEKEVQNG